MQRIQKGQIKAERDEKIRSMWLACYTQEEIADEVNQAHNTITDTMKSLSDLANFPKPTKLSAEFNDPEGSISNKNLKPIKTNFKTTLEYHKTCKTLNPLNTDYYPDPL